MYQLIYFCVVNFSDTRFSLDALAEEFDTSENYKIRRKHAHPIELIDKELFLNAIQISKDLVDSNLFGPRNFIWSDEIGNDFNSLNTIQRSSSFFLVYIVKKMNVAHKLRR